MHDQPPHGSEAHVQTPLAERSFPFELNDSLVEPFPSFMVICITFDRPIEQSTMADLAHILDEWMATNTIVAKSQGNAEPEGEALQSGAQTVEFQVQGAQGDPDALLKPMLERLAKLSCSSQRIIEIQMD